MKLISIGLVCAVAACGGTPAVAPAPAPAPAPAAATSTPPPSCTIRGEQRQEDLDGDGAAEPIVWNGRELCVGGRTIPVDLDAAGAVEQRVVDLDPARPGRELVLVDPGIEDDARYFVFVFDGELHPAGAVFVGNEPELPGDGTMVTHNGNCGQSTTAVWRLVDHRMQLESEETTGTYDDAQCAACPFVYVERDGKRELVGEILRNLRGPAAATLQALPLRHSALHDNAVRILIREEKAETTYLDEIYLEVDGIAWAPLGCEHGGAWCDEDGIHHVIAPGESLTLEFEPGVVPPGARIALQARGYYVPHH